jgi:hypothetical protein
MSTALPLADTPALPDATACCGGPPSADASACCALDEAQKAAGRAGCGCASASCCATAPPPDTLSPS